MLTQARLARVVCSRERRLSLCVRILEPAGPVVRLRYIEVVPLSLVPDPLYV